MIKVNIPSTSAFSYPILIGTGILPKAFAKTIQQFKQIVIITDHKVKKYYGHLLTQKLTPLRQKFLLLSFAAGETSKNIQQKTLLEEKMLSHHCSRDTLIIALGGGVVGDMAGFIAATYMRGIAYIQIPTTLLAMVDSSTGGKTGINTTHGKNLLGAFWQPKAVIIDVKCLTTLPKKQFYNGLIEAIKIFLTSDKKSFQFLQKNWPAILTYQEKILISVIRRSVKLKASIVEKDEKENNLRMILNFGHTIGHALEKISQYTLLHGYAVAYGMLVEAKISQLMGILTHQKYLLIKETLARLGITGNYLKKFSADKIIQSTRVDKKTRAQKPQYILLQHIGQVYMVRKEVAHHVPDKIVKRALSVVKEE